MSRAQILTLSQIPRNLTRLTPGAVVTPFASAYTPSPHTFSGYGSPYVNMYPPAPRTLHQITATRINHPSTPIYHFSNDSMLSSQATHVSSDTSPASGAGPGYGETGHDGSQHGGTQYEYANSIGHPSITCRARILNTVRVQQNAPRFIGQACRSTTPRFPREWRITHLVGVSVG
jgi:hypothetical protein